MASIKQAFNEAVERGKCNIYLFIIKYSFKKSIMEKCTKYLKIYNKYYNNI